MRKKFYRKAFAVSGLLALAGPSMAQDRASTPSDSDSLEEIIVTGIRGSLQRSLDIKKEAAGVVDAISSEDIGKFPDSNVAASLQRVPGISIQRNGQRGEPTGVTVRGFGGDFNETLYDGRRISTASGGRSVDFSTVGSDFVGTLSVLKTPDLTLGASSIGATINVQYPKPFDNPGMKFVASGSGNYQDESADVRPTGGVLFSDTFANDTLGILVDAIYSDRKTTTNRVFVSGWEGGKFKPCQLTTTCAPGNTEAESVVGWWQQQYGAEQSEASEKRVDGRIAFQWRPSDNFLLTLDDNYSRQKITTEVDGFALWFNRGDLRSVQLDDNGTVVNFIQPGTPMDLNASTTDNLVKTNQTGLNLAYDASENLSFNLDLSYAKSESNPNGEGSDGGDIGYGGTLGTPLGVRVTGDSSSSFPQLTTYGPAGDQSRYLDPSAIGSHVLVRTHQENSDTIKQGRFTTTFKQDNLRLDMGLSYLHDNFELQNSNTFANNFWQAFSGYGAPSGRTSGVVLPTSLYHGTISTSGFIPGFSGGGSLPPTLQRYSSRELYAFLEGLGDPWTHQVDGFNYPGPVPIEGVPTPPGTLANSLAHCGPGAPDHPALCDYHGSLDLMLDPGSIQDITEKTLAGFIRAGFDTEVGSMPFHFSAGVREERTDVTSAGVGRVPVRLDFSSGDPTLLTTTFSPTQPISTKSHYSFLLPSMDMKLELTDSVHLRFDASRTLTRPAINTLSPVLNVGSLPRIGSLTATGGNPDLKPYLSDNFDAAVEWYYQPNSYAAVNLFVKHVTNFIVGGTQRQVISPTLMDPSTNAPAVYTVSQRVNGPEATIDGVELAWQHVFGDTGFGFNANVTLVDTDKPYDKNDISQSGFAVTGLANSANFVGFYDKNGFEARVAANWRDEYLLQFGQNQNNSLFGAEPTFVNSSLQIDLSTSYQLTDQLNVYFEALNVTNETM
ncbi:MAG TPA: TonB-dependent receptor, partial [Steroidobacteraceae bacterium]|nr:TonB-dependent receptor [Steroidobacteraceae bacterium]